MALVRGATRRRLGRALGTGGAAGGGGAELAAGIQVEPARSPAARRRRPHAAVRGARALRTAAAAGTGGGGGAGLQLDQRQRRARQVAGGAVPAGAVGARDRFAA